MDVLSDEGQLDVEAQAANGGNITSWCVRVHGCVMGVGVRAEVCVSGCVCGCADVGVCVRMRVCVCVYMRTCVLFETCACIEL